MKKFETMTELELLNAAYKTVLGRWAREREFVGENPANEIAVYHMNRYWAMLKELSAEIIRLERAVK